MTLTTLCSRCSSRNSDLHHLHGRPLSPSAAVLMAAVLNSSSADASTRNFRQLATAAGNSNSTRHHRRKKQRRRAASQGPKPTAEVFATILLCSGGDGGGDSMSGDNKSKNKYARGMTMFRHIHSKISQDVCNAIFLCKVEAAVDGAHRISTWPLL